MEIQELGNELINLRNKYDILRYPSVSIIIVSNRPNMWPNAIANVERQKYPGDIELVFIANTGEDNFKQWQFYTNKKWHASYRWFKSVHSLGKSLNFAQSEAHNEIFIKMDDDDLYGENYVIDVVRGLEIGNGDVIAKPNGWIYFTEYKTLHYLGRINGLNIYSEYTGNSPVFGGTLAWRSKIYYNHKIRFKDINKGEDTDWVKQILKHKIKFISGDPWNYIWIRKSNSHHTYKFDYNKILLSTSYVKINSLNELQTIFL